MGSKKEKDTEAAATTDTRASVAIPAAAAVSPLGRQRGVEEGEFYVMHRVEIACVEWKTRKDNFAVLQNRAFVAGGICCRLFVFIKQIDGGVTASTSSEVYTVYLEEFSFVRREDVCANVWRRKHERSLAPQAIEKEEENIYRGGDSSVPRHN